jgi:putative SOS response-associated peptidase YedK
MCSNYEAVTEADRLLHYFGLTQDLSKPHIAKSEIWPTGYAPFIRLAEDGSGNRVLDSGHFGLLPAFAKEVTFGRKTYNARSETVHSKPSFRDAWRKGWRCIIPVQVVYEQCYEGGKAERWTVHQGGIPMGLAGIYSPWIDADGKTRGTFAMLTINADGHPVYSRFHAPGEEKRMVVILDPKDYDRWLVCTPDEAKGFFKQWQGELITHPAPLRPRARKTQ